MFCRILNGPDFRRLGPIARACLWPLKLRLPTAGIGVIPALVATLAEDTGFSEDEVRAALIELEARPSEGPSEGGSGAHEGRPEWVRREGTVVWLVRGLEFEPTANANDVKHRLHIRRTLASLPTIPLVEAYKSRYSNWFIDEPTPQPPRPTEASINGHTRPSEGPSETPRSKTQTHTHTTKSKQIRPTSPVFEQAWASYPKRQNNSKAEALRMWNARVADGVEESVMLAGTKAYAAYVASEGTDPKYVKLGATFYGPGEHYASDFTPGTNGKRISGGYDDGLRDEPRIVWMDEIPVPPDYVPPKGAR